MEKTTSILAEFISGITFEDIPDGVVRETKRILIDSIGCALGGLYTRKGRISLSFAKNVSSQSEATIIGAKKKFSASLASFVNGELFNALDYDALSAPFGHITPYVLSAPLAVAEWKKVQGKDLIVAVTIAHEIAQRICLGLVVPASFSRKTTREGISIHLPIHGYGVNIFGGIAGVLKILGLDSDKIEHALGIGGYMCPVPTLMQFAEAVPASMSKFSPVGWISQAEVTAALLAEMGYTGDRNILDGEFGFWKSFAADGWNPEVVVNELGKSWFLPDMVGYKRYPCCGAMHGALDIFYAIIDKFSIQPEDIKEINIALNLLAELPLWQNRKIESHIDAQFSAAYVFAVAAHRIDIGHKWQTEETYNAPEILGFMKRINIFTPASQDYDKKRYMVEVIVQDKNTAEDRTYTERNVRAVNSMVDDEELYEKFKGNAAGMLSTKDIEQALRIIICLEELDNIGHLMSLFSFCQK